MRSDDVPADKTLFLSRAGEDSAIAAQIGTILEAAGYRVVLQQWDFANRSFMDAMHSTLAGGARVVALLSDAYLASEYCTAEWQAVLADDPLNKRSRLIVMRVEACKPIGLLTPIAYWDLVPVKSDRRLLADVVRNAVAEGRRGQDTPVAGRYWRGPSTVLDPAAIREVPGFTGRDRELSVLETALWDGAGRAVAHGLGGTGKSSLAREYAWRHRGRYVAVGWLRSDTETGIVDGLRWLGSQFVPDLEQLKDRAQAAERALSLLVQVAADAGKPLLLIFDNLEDRALLRAWQPREHAHVLITSRKSSWGGGFVRVSVEPLRVDEAVTYLRRESGRTDLDDDDLTAVAEAVGQLPLALSHAAAYFDATHTATAQSYLDRLSYHMAHAPDDAEYPVAAFATFREAIAQVEKAQPGAAAAVSLAAFFAPDEIPEELFHPDPECELEPLTPPLDNAGGPPLSLRAALVDSGRTEEILGALSQFSLITFAAESRTFGIHRLVQAAIRDFLRDDAIAWLQNAIQTVLLAFPLDVALATWRRCERVMIHAKTTLAALPDEHGTSYAAVLAFRCGLYFIDRAAYGEGVDVLRRALAFDTACPVSDTQLRISVLNGLGICLRHLNRLEEAASVHGEARSLAEAMYGYSHPEVAASLNNLGLVLSMNGRFSEADEAYRRAHEIKEATLAPDDPRLAVSLVNMAAAFGRAGDTPKAVEYLRRAVSIHEAYYGPNHPEVAKNLANLGFELGSMEEFSEAESLIQRAIEIDRETYGERHPSLGIHLGYLAKLREREGRFAEAVALWRDSLAIMESVFGPSHPDVAYTLASLGIAVYALGDLAESAAILEHALDVARVVYPADSFDTATIVNFLELVRKHLASGS